MQRKKTAVWRGLSGVCCILLALSMILGNILEANAATVDTYLGTLSSKTVADNLEDMYTVFTPSSEVLNDDGSGNSRALIEKAIALGHDQAVEGAVLLKNENGVLPLSEDSNVTLFGIRSHINLIGSSLGMKAMGPYISLEQALSQNRTDFANTIAYEPGLSPMYGGDGLPKLTISGGWSGDEFDFDGAGYHLNQTMIDIYEKLNETYMHTENEGAKNVYDPREPSVAELEGVDPDYKASFAQYGDAAIVYFARPSAEGTDYLPGSVAEGTGAKEPLELTTNEKAVLALAKECSDKVIVLIASSTSVEIADLKNDPEVDAILWIGAVGNYGNLGIADILSGKVSPSGRLFDLFAAYNMSAPAMQNMGNFEYANSDTLTRGGSNAWVANDTYTIEAEGIYVGYRYYETRYYDTVVGRGNASSAVGAYASETEWDYTNEVTYGFGYGLSYTDFDFEIVNDPVPQKTTSANGATEYYMTFEVKVTNNGAMAGKTPVQIYAQAPYYDNGIEKAAIQLMNFGKTGIIKPGDSETVTITIDLQYLASFDEHGEGTYVFEAGDYYFAVGNGAHDALNHVLAAQGYTTADGMDYDGNADQAIKLTVDESVVPYKAFAVSKTGYEITNQLEYADWNYYQEGEVTYLSRMDWAGTWPKTYADMTIKADTLYDHLNGLYYEVQTDDDVSGIVWGQDNGIQFYQMTGVAYDDPLWDQLLNQITMEEAQYMATFGGPSIPGIESINLAETYQTENAGNGVSVALNASKTPDAPWSIAPDDTNGNWHPEVFCNAPLGASSFNPDLYYRLGNFIGEESLFVGINILWGPGLNTHRHAYNGRNGEYYSEDPILSGVAAMEFAIGALKNGLIAAPKHFAFNDQETNRIGVAPYMTEQRAREVELRAYQYAFEATKYDTADYNAGMRGLMISFSKIGGVECTASYGLMTEILANEWGFIGYAVTDIQDDLDIYGSVLTSGATCYDTRGMSGFYTNTTLASPNFANQVDGIDITTALNGDARLQNAVKTSVHKNLYAMSESHLMNRYVGAVRVEQLMPWWRTAYYAAIAVSAVLMVLCFVMYAISARKEHGQAKGKLAVGAYISILAGVLGVVGLVATVASSNISVDNELASLTNCLVVGVLGVGSSVAAVALASKNDMIRAACNLGTIAAFMYILNNLISERVMLVASLFTFNQGNDVGWQVFYVTVVAGAALLLASIAVIVSGFMKTVKEISVTEA